MFYIRLISRGTLTLFFLAQYDLLFQNMEKRMLQTLDMIANKKKKLILEERKSTMHVSDSKLLILFIILTVTVVRYLWKFIIMGYRLMYNSLRWHLNCKLTIFTPSFYKFIATCRPIIKILCGQVSPPPLQEY